MTINGTPITEHTLVRIVQVDAALEGTIFADVVPFQTLKYLVESGYTTEQIVTIVTTNQPVAGLPDELRRNDSRLRVAG